MFVCLFAFFTTIKYDTTIALHFSHETSVIYLISLQFCRKRHKATDMIEELSRKLITNARDQRLVNYFMQNN